MKQLSKQKQALVLAALREGAPLNAVTRMFSVSIHTVLRVIRDTGEMFADYMDKELRNLPCKRIEMDEQWQYVGCHKGRMPKSSAVYERGDQTRGDFWLWACIDADTKLVLSHRIGKRDYGTASRFVRDVRERVAGPVQIATDNNISYAGHIRAEFGYDGIQLRNRNQGIRRADDAGRHAGPFWTERGRSQNGDSGTARP